MTSPNSQTEEAGSSTDVPLPTGVGLKEKVASGVSDFLIIRVAMMGIQVVNTAVLARLLLPSDFGLAAMAATVTGLLGIVGDGGISTAVIQRKDLTDDDLSSAFWLNLCVGALLMAIAWVAAWPTAVFYEQPELLVVLLAAGLAFPLGAFVNLQSALLARRLEFHKQATLQVLGVIATVAVGITLALLGAGYWALILAAPAGSILMIVPAWRKTRWLPSFTFRTKRTRELLLFGGATTLFAFLWFGARQGDNVMIGKAWGEADLGFYVKAYGLLMLPIMTITQPFSSAILPTLSRLQDSPSEFERVFHRATGLIVFLAMPVAVFSILCADVAIRVLYGPDWGPSVPLFRALAFSAPIQPVLACLGWLFVAKGNVWRQVGVGIANLIVLLAAFWFGLPHGPIGVAIAYSIAMVGVLFLPNVIYACRVARVPVAPMALHYLRTLPQATAMAAMLLALQYAFGDRVANAYLWGAILLGSGCAVYAATGIALKDRTTLQVIHYARGLALRKR
ncbi:lipopolysaccharide biosynthesis protein [bacterium]|nr:lipopolysaccharide biosynthesis protein [bacterium]